MSKKEIIIFVVALILGGLIFGNLKSGEFWEDEDDEGEERTESEWSLLTLIDPWLGSDLNQTAAPASSEPADTTKPTLKIISPADGAEFGSEETAITVKLEASDDSGKVFIALQNLSATGKVRKTYDTANGTVENFELYPGLNTLLALAKDEAGNVATHFVIVSKNSATPPAQPPTTPPPAPANTPATESATRGDYRDGRYEGTGYYAFGEDKYPLTVRLTVVNGRIEELEYLAFPKSDLVKDESFLNPMKSAVLAGQTAEVDTISGATGTSEAFLTAVREAVGKAK